MKAVIKKILEDQIKYGEAIQGPANHSQIEQCAEALDQLFSANLPKEFADFLAITNGIDYNGVIIYGASQSPNATGPGDFWQGLIAANTIWREEPSHQSYLILGETDMDIFTVSLEGTEPFMREKISGEIIERFNSISDAINEILARRL